MAINPGILQRRKERHLYIGAAVIIPLIVLAGFARTYYLKTFFGDPALPGRLVQLHGVVMTSWVLLFVTQVSLVSVRRTRLHQRLGILGAILAALVVVVGTLTAIDAAARHFSPDALRFLVIPFGDMLIFAILIGAALYFRRRLDVHKRLMLLAAVNLLTPAIARFPFHFIEIAGPFTPFGLTDLCVLSCVAFDTFRHRRLHPVFLWGTILIVVSQVLRVMLGNTDAWLRFATSLVGFK